MLSLSFVTANAAYFGLTVLLVAVAPLFTITENNTENEAFCGAKTKYTVQCFAFQARVWSYDNKVICEDSGSVGMNCWNILHEINNGNCKTGNDLCDVLVGISQEMEDYFASANLFAFIIILFGGLAFVSLMCVFLFEKWRDAFWQVQMLLLLASAGIAAALMHVSAQTVNAATVKTSFNTAQTISPNAGLVVLVVYPLFQLLSLNMVSLWNTSG